MHHRYRALTLAIATLIGALAGCAVDLEAAPEIVPPGPPQAYIPCGSIHAVQIAQDEGLADCTTAAIGAVPLSTRGLGCAGLTADACATRHYDNAWSYFNPAGTGSFELQYLPAEDQLFCADGTRPHYYFSPGTDSSKWIIYQNGGSGKCGRTVNRAGVYSDAGSDCYALFASGDGNSGFHRNWRWEGEGIMDGGPINRDFHDWNRVWIPSCSNDQYQGSADHPAEAVLTGRAVWQAPLYSHGFDIVLAVIDDLAVGQYHRLSNATLVMLYGTSGGAGGLQMTLDAKAEHVRMVSSARVVGLLDSRSEPNIAGAEGLFDGDEASCSSIFAGDCPGNFDVPAIGTDVGAGFDFDSTAYQDAAACVGCGTARTKTEWWGNNLDESCALLHAANLDPCYDGYHVVYEDTDTPVFHATSLRDHNQYNGALEYVTVAEGDAVTFQSLEVAPNCGDLPRERVIGQLDAYARRRDAKPGAHGASHDAGPIGIWAIDWADHEITKSSCIFNDAKLDGRTLSRSILRWAVDEIEVVLIDAPGHATRTVNPTCAQQVNTCP